MSRRGLYIGGHTVIGPGSGWFSHKKPKAKPPRQPLTPKQIAKKQDDQRLAADRRQKIKRENKERQRREQEAAAARQAAKRAARNSPEAVAKRAEMAPVIRARLERRMESVTVIRRQLATAPKLTTKGATSSQEEHMYKGKSASMQRGALVRNSSPRMTRREEYSQTKIVLTDAEHCHFSFGSVQEHHLLAELRPVVKAFARGGIRKPHDVARALNKAGKRTACGEHWTPRLVWFLLSKMFVPGAARKPGNRGANRPDRPPSARISNGSASATSSGERGGAAVARSHRAIDR
jgi:hypothetical protein